MKSLSIFRLTLVILIGLSCSGLAQEKLPSLENLEQQINQLEDGDNSANKASTLELLKALKQSIEETRASETKQSYLLNQITAAPKTLLEINSNIKSLSEPADAIEHAELTTAKIDNRTAAVAAELSVAQAEAAKLTKQEDLRAARKKQIPELLARAQADHNELQTTAAPNKSATADDRLKSQLQRSKLTALKFHIAELTTEQKYYQETTELFTAQKHYAALHKASLEKLYAEWQQISQQRHAQETAQSKEQARQQAQRFEHVPELVKITSQISQFLALRSEVLAYTNTAQTTETKVTAHRVAIVKQRKNAQERISLLESTGIRIDAETGGLLRRQRAKLPTAKDLQKALKKNMRAMTNSQIKLLELKDEFDALPLDRRQEITKLMESIHSEDISSTLVSTLLDNRDSELKSTIKSYEDYITVLRSLNISTKQAIVEVDIYSGYLDKRLLWIPSAERFSKADFHTEWKVLQRVVTYDLGWTWSENLFTDLRVNWIIWLTFAVGITAMMIRRGRYLKILKETSAIASHPKCASSRPTLKALGVTLLLALPAPLVFAFLAWRVAEPQPLSLGFLIIAIFFTMAGTLRHLARPHGIFEAHFPISDTKTTLIHRHLSWFIYVGAIVGFLAISLPLSTTIPHGGRIFFILSLVVFGIFLHCLLRPEKRLFLRKTAPLWQRKLLYAVCLGLPVIFIIGAGYGYITSIQKIRGNIMLSVWFTLLIFFIVHLLLRFILISRRRLASQQAAQEYQALLDARKENPENTQEHASLEELKASAINPVKVEAQTKRLVKVAAIAVVFFGYMGIWSTTLPALSVLDDIRFFENNSERKESKESSLPAPDLVQTLSGNPQGGTSHDVAEKDQGSDQSKNADRGGISLGDILMTLVIIFLTLVAARNLPGLLELSLLRKIQLQPGGNYAITTVMRYIIIAIGFLMAFSRIGITWSSVQWLAAAITLGIGFGLQEIFANFVAGIIVLFERPMRLGDVVTVGNVSGKVTQIQIRATTIRQFNNRELLVPNKEFITGQLVNWTLRDSILRFELPVGIAYGSDTEKATKILMKVARANKGVLKTPEPQVLFTAFGQSTLDFTLRGFVANPDHFVQTQSQLHYSIDQAFREADIEIAFPQTDIHIRSLPSADLTELLAKAAKEKLDEEK